MNMGKMKNAPLIYTLGMLKFPRIPAIERFTEQFMEAIRADYPHDDQDITKVINASIGSEGIKLQDPQEIKMWQFASIDRKWAFILTDQALFLHTANYHDFADFSRRFQKGVAALVKLPEIDIKYMTSLGIRYVNLISTEGKIGLGEYLNPWVLPGNLPSNASLDVIQGINAVRYKTAQGELRFQAIQNPSFTLLPELNSSFVAKNSWVKERPKSTFALIDIDHGTNWETPLKFDKTVIADTLSSLRKTSRRVFDSIGTDKAIKSWRE